MPLGAQLSLVTESLRRSTVHVRSGHGGAGSGVIWQSDGLIVTNAHVVRHRQPAIELADGRELVAEVRAVDPERDLAALQVSATDLPAAPVGDSSRLRVGQLVLAVGNPLGLSGALSLGIIHAMGVERNHRWVQADVRLAPGNSGGPLADALGRVIGINSMIAGGLGLAVPSNEVRSFLGERPRLGVTTQPVAARFAGRDVAGLLILDVEAGSAASTASLLVGDIILGAGERPIRSPRDLGTALIVSSGMIHLDILRGGRQLNVTVPLTGGESSSREAA